MLQSHNSDGKRKLGGSSCHNRLDLEEDAYLAQRWATELPERLTCSTLKEAKGVFIASMSSKITATSDLCIHLYFHSETN
jgi:hypothetical protein